MRRWRAAVQRRDAGRRHAFPGLLLAGAHPDDGWQLDVLTFTACDLSPLSTPLLPKIGSYSVLVTGAQGVVYQKSGAMTSGFVSIHPH